jgi:sulfatase-like protein
MAVTLASLAAWVRGRPDAAEPPPGPRWRTELRAFLELFVLCGFAITQPVLDVAGRSPEFFLFNQAGPGEILLLAAAVTLLPALAGWLAEVLVGLVGRRPRRLLHLVMVTGLLTVIAIEVAKKLLPLRGGRLALLALAVGLAATWLLATRPALQLWLRYLSPAPVVFVLVFALMSPAARLVQPQDGAPAAASPGAAGAGNAPPVVMLIFDEFPTTALLDRRGQIDKRMYPNFARLAGDATWYRNATAVNGYTPFAVPAILTGRYPAREIAPIYTQHPGNLFTLLGRTHTLKVDETVTRLCPPRLCPTTAANASRDPGFGGLAKDTAEIWTRIALPYDSQPDPDAQFAEETADADPATPAPKPGQRLAPNFLLTREQGNRNQPTRFTTFLEGMQQGERPTFHFLHLMLPHTPWRHLPTGTRYPVPATSFGRANSTTWGDQPWPVALSHQRFLLQLAYTDRLIGQLIDRLERQGLYDDALVVVTADHGMSFQPGKHTRAPAEGTAHETAWVPTFVKRPGQAAGEVSDRNVEVIDLVPTIADILGVPLTWEPDGISALGQRQRGPEKSFYIRPGRAHRITLDGPANLALALQGTTDRVLRPQDGRIGLYRIGRHGALVGTPTSAARVGGRSALQVEVTSPTGFEALDPASGTLPALLTGRVEGRPAPGTAVAVAVNGTIGGVSEVFPDARDDDKPGIAALVPDFLFRKGANRVELFEVGTAGGAPVLHPIRWRT